MSKRSLATTVLGHKVSVPFGVAPTAMQKMACPDGECANARGEVSFEYKLFLSNDYWTGMENVNTEIKALKC